MPSKTVLATEKKDFTEWIMPKIEKIGGMSVFCQKLKLRQYDRKSVLAWVYGLQAPGYKVQITICTVLGCKISEIRKVLGRPYTPFAELLTKKILPYGKSADFPRKTGIPKSSYNKWISEGRLPSNASDLENSSELRSIRDALILWGDRNPPDLLMQQLAESVKKTIADRKMKRKQLFNEE